MNTPPQSLVRRVALAAALVVLPLAGQAGPNGTVLSANVKDADGTTGQDSTRGAGIKTPHLQNLAVTNAKLGAAAVTADKLATGAVTTDKLAAGAVTDAKISGTISAAKLPVGGGAGTVAAGNHNHDGVYQKRYANVIVVAKSGGDFTDPVAAMASITDASATNPYLIKIMPGEYQIAPPTQAGEWRIKSYVDIEGSGAGVTALWTSNGYFLWPEPSAPFTAEIRGLTMRTSVFALNMVADVNVTLRNAVVMCDPGAGFHNCSQIVVQGGLLVLDNVIIDATQFGTGATWPFSQAAGEIRMFGGECRSPAEGGCLASGGGSFRAAGVRLQGGPLVNPHYVFGGTAKCVHCFTGDFDPIP